MTKEEFEQLKSTVKQWLFHTGSLDPTNYANELKVKFIEPREKRIAELEAQIEKMKCCGNCIHCYEGAYHNGYRCKDHAKESVCDNWEMMTDEVRKEMLEDD